MAPRCGIVFEGDSETCPVCGGHTATALRIRRRGWLVAACGVLLTGMMGALILWIWPRITNPGVEINGSSFDGPPAAAIAVLGILLLVFAIGVVALYGGVHQIRTGQRDRNAVSLMIWLATAFMVIGGIAEMFA